MTDWWARLTLGRAVSSETYAGDVGAAYNHGHDAGLREARLRYYATPEVTGSFDRTSVTLGPGMAVWDDGLLETADAGTD